MDEYSSLLTSVTHAKLSAQTQDFMESIGYTSEMAAVDLKTCRPLFHATVSAPYCTAVPIQAGTQRKLHNTDVTTTTYARICLLLAIGMHVTRHMPTRLAVVHGKWLKVFGSLTTLFSLRAPTEPDRWAGLVADELRRSGANPADPSVAIFSLHSALITHHPDVLATARRVFDAGMETLYGNDLVTEPLEPFPVEGI